MTCAFDACMPATCALEGGCVVQRFAHVPKYTRADTLRKDAKALNGTKPRPSRDPRFITRTRKAIVK